MLPKWNLLTSAMKVVICVSIAGVIVSGSLALRSRYLLNQATEKEREADRLNKEGIALKAEAATIKAQADRIAGDLAKANAKVEKLQAIVDKIVVPPKPTSLPASTTQTLAELRQMGLDLPSKPSLALAPSVAGFTVDDAGKVWYWGKEALRVPPLELKLEKTVDLVNGLEKAKSLAESLAESRTQQAEASFKAAEKFENEARVQREVSANLKKALSTEKKKKILYGVGGVVLGAVIAKR